MRPALRSFGEDPEVSVVIPVFNAEATIGRAIASVLHQEAVTLELVVVDDGSSDGTRDMVRRYAAEDRRIALYPQARNRGPAAARNLGLAAARGRWVAFLDADDRFRTGRLARLLGLAEEGGADMVADNIRFVDGNERALGAGLAERTPPRTTRLTAAEFVRGNRFLVPGFKLGYLKPMFRRAFLTSHELRQREELAIAEDYHFYLDALLRDARFIVTEAALYDYTVTPGSQSKGFAIEHLQQLETLNQTLLAESSGDLATSLTARQRSIELNIAFMRFVAALKAGAAYRAVRLFAGSPSLAPHLWRYGLESLSKRAARLRLAASGAG